MQGVGCRPEGWPRESEVGEEGEVVGEPIQAQARPPSMQGWWMEAARGSRGARYYRARPPYRVVEGGGEGEGDQQARLSSC